MYVVIWQPKDGFDVGGGHQSVQDKAKAEALRWQLERQRPQHHVRIEMAAEYSASAVKERLAQQRRRSRRC